MVSASLYITACSAKNRVRTRMRRLREPRYLIGAVVGAAYFYFAFFARSRSGRSSAARRAARGARPVPESVSAVIAAAPAFAGLVLLALTAVSWIAPINSGLLDFSEAETQFLFPAPVSRRQLLVHRILRSQVGLLFSAVIVGLVMPSAGGYTRLRVSIAMWVTLVTAKIYFTGLTLARARLLSTSAYARKVAWLPVAAIFGALAVVVAALVRAFAVRTSPNVVDVLTRVNDVLTHGVSRIVLWPFVAVVRPLFAEWPQPYLSSLAIAVVMLGLTTVWVLKSDEAFQDAAAAAFDRRERETARQAVSYRVRGTAWQLPTSGRAEIAFAWKAAIQTLRVVDRRTFMRIAAPVIALTLAASSWGRSNSLATAIGLFATVAAVSTVFIAPQALRIDMRQDLRHLEVLKTWPVPPSTVVRGEMLWPGALLTGLAWLFLAIAALLSGTVFPNAGFVVRVSTAAAAAVVAPALVFAQLTIHNGVALIFPAWVPVGGQRTRGLDAMGQRLIMLTATLLLLIVMVLPGALAGGIVAFAFRGFAGAAAFVPAAVVCAAILIIEVLLATEMLGPAYERLDAMAVERAE